ncbi:hypothetical protein K504DRAFT_452902 [Pleomassaria siparia CBS 279.74]|uniref:RCC1/BLIP-II n=1 Tax=Pleomassaria siparia CBS 279.74 TaxID=1314801 RepID=A0A6G1KIM8_9PLEO|nr:hypothetical protein K504DRAFT_452902 [Pleomassaria siparia CBS 279.74]
MELWTFGFNGHAQLEAQLSTATCPGTSRLSSLSSSSSPSSPSSPSSSSSSSSEKEDYIYAPKLVLQGHSIQVLWSSWCDALVLIQPTPHSQPCPYTIYAGTGVLPTTISDLKPIIHATVNESEHLHFFGAPLGPGLQGVLKASTSVIGLLNPIRPRLPPEINTSSAERFVLGYAAVIPSNPEYIHGPREDGDPHNLFIKHISVTSGGHVSAVAINKSKEFAIESSVVGWPSVAGFEKWLDNGDIIEFAGKSMPIPNVANLVSNATSTTALSTAAQVYTWTSDPRYPTCLGRLADADAPASHPHPVPYLSETNIVSIASGGYLTAALSADGELFVWGQACPGTTSSLSVLRQDDDGDEWVKCVELEIDGQEARVTHVAIGFGHVIVAAEAIGRGHVERAVFAAGQGESGQLGVGKSPTFIQDFRQVEALRGKKIKELRAAGWSSWVVVEVQE